MNIAKIQVNGIDAVALDAMAKIPAGIVGATVQMEYTGDIWAGLNKAVVFRGNTTREVLTNENTVTVPAEVLAEPRGRFRVGVYGTDAANNVIMPTMWAEVGIIAESAVPAEPADSSLPVWAQLWAMIGNLSNLDTNTKSSLVSAINETMAKTDTSGGNSGGSAALTTAQIEAIHGMFKVCAYDDSKDVSGAYAAFMNAFGITDEPVIPDEPDEPDVPEVTLSSISATYSGGDVAVGTAVSDLTGIVVTAHYSDGTSNAVTGYTLSGTIAESSNTVTVSYGGKTTTFTVTGVVESTETAVEMGSWGGCGDYQFNGGAIYADDGTSGETIAFGSGASTATLSNMVFEVDTNVKIVLTWESNCYDSFCVGSSSSETVNKKIVMYHAITAGTQTALASGTTEIEYTVKAGYRLAIMARNGFPGSVTVTATEV